MAEINLITKLVGDIQGNFYVPNYQRGYRWEKTEVETLLNDINEYGGKIKKTDNENYCLQPVVVRNLRDKYELIDGQQRLTTLYLIYVYMNNLTYVSPEQFSRRLRTLNNLLLNSSDQISDSEERQDGNRLPAILRQVDSIILEGVIADSERIGINFNPSQLEEEKSKLEWTKNNPDKAEMLFALEDHELLYGHISVVGLEHPEYFERFESLFRCDWDLVDCALFTFGDYKQKERNGWRYQLGSAMSDGFAWKTLFHKSENFIGFDTTKSVLHELLMQDYIFTDEYLKKMVDNYIADCENHKQYPWIYYYIKYNVFRPGRYGKYWWNDFEKSPYVFTILFQRQKVSENSYNPFLKAVNDNVWREHWGNRIYISEIEFLRETQTSFQVISNDENEDLLMEFPINQNENGIDIENRIEKMRCIFETIINKE